MRTIEKKFKVLSVDEQSFKNQNGQLVSFTTLLCRDEAGTLIFKTNRDFDFSKFVDKEVTLEIEIESDFNKRPSLRARSVLPK